MGAHFALIAIGALGILCGKGPIATIDTVGGITCGLEILSKIVGAQANANRQKLLAGTATTPGLLVPAALFSPALLTSQPRTILRAATQPRTPPRPKRNIRNDNR